MVLDLKRARNEKNCLNQILTRNNMESIRTLLLVAFSLVGLATIVSVSVTDRKKRKDKEK
jgi:hypothetical protein